MTTRCLLLPLFTIIDRTNSTFDVDAPEIFYSMSSMCQSGGLGAAHSALGKGDVSCARMHPKFRYSNQEVSIFWNASKN